MLQHYSLINKVFILTALYFVVGFTAYLLCSVLFSSENIFTTLAVNFLLCWDLMLVGFFFFQAFKYIRFPSSFYEKRKIETELWFKLLGVQIFRIVLINSFFKKLNTRVYLKGRGKAYYKIFIEETKQSETSHMFSFLATFILQVIFFYHECFNDFIVLSTFSIVFNIYPILLQRKNRFLMLKTHKYLCWYRDLIFY